MKVITLKSLPEGARTGLLIGEGPKWIRVIWPDAAGIRIHRVAKDRSLKFTETEYRGRPYPVTRAKSKLRQMGRRVGISKTARRALA